MVSKPKKPIDEPMTEMPTDYAAPVSSEEYGSNETNRPDLLQEERNKSTAISFKDFSLFPDDFLIINDVYLSNIPTAAVNIQSATDVFVGETLRTKAPVISSEGKQSFVLNLSIPFNSGDTQKNELFRIVSVIKKHPLVFIYNNKIKKNLGVGLSDTTMFMLESASLRTTAETVGVIVLDLTLHYFNHKPFSNNFLFNTKLGGIERKEDDLIEDIDSGINLQEMKGYEASEYTLSYLTEKTLKDARSASLDAFDQKKTNVPVNFPAASDAWMWFAQNIRDNTTKITNNGSDYIGLSVNEFTYISPPASARNGQGTLDRIYQQDQKFLPINDAYNPKSYNKEETVQDKTRKETYENNENVHPDVAKDPHRKIKFVRKRTGETLSLQLTTAPGVVNEDSLVALSKLAGPQEKINGKWTYVTGATYLKPALILILQKIADKFPGRTFKINSGVRFPRNPFNKTKKFRPHVEGAALDFSLSGVEKRVLHRYLLTLKNVGCGLYPNTDFAHVDTRNVNNRNINWVDLSHPGDKSITLKSKEKQEYLSEFFNGMDSTQDAIDEDREIMAEDIQQNKENRDQQAQDVASTQGGTAAAVEDAKRKAKEKQDRATTPSTHTVDIQESREHWIDSLANDNWFYYFNDPKLQNLFYKPYGVEISGDKELQGRGQTLPNIVCSSINVTFGHRIAAMRLVGQPYYTYQFLGAGNKVGQMVFTFAGESGRFAADRIKELVRKSRDNARIFSSLIKEAGSISVNSTLFSTGQQNTILALAEIENIVITNIEEGSTPDGVDKHQLIVEFLVQDFAEEGMERKFITSLDSKKQIIRGLMKHVKYRDLKSSEYRAMRASSKILSALSRTDLPRSLQVVKGVPSWVGVAVAKTVEICQRANDAAPPTNWKIDDSGRKTWNDAYNEWGAGDKISGLKNNIPKKFRLLDLVSSLIDDSDKLYSSMTKAGAEAAHKKHEEAYDNWLAEMNTVVNEVRQYVTDEKNFEKYIGTVGKEILDAIAEGLGECYEDMDLPNVPNTNVTLPPEFYVYDDSDENPLASNSTDKTNLERLLYRHMDNEIKSLKELLSNRMLGGSYLSTNLPKILESRAREVKDMTGEFDFYDNYTQIYTEGANAWDPIYYTQDEAYESGDGKAWLGFVKDSLGGGSDDDQRLEFFTRASNLSSYVKEGRGWSGESDNQDIVETLYGDAWNKISFGPNPEFTQIDNINNGIPASPLSKAAREAIQEQNLTKNSIGASAPLAFDDRTVLNDGSVLVGKLKEEEESSGSCAELLNWDFDAINAVKTFTSSVLKVVVPGFELAGFAASESNNVSLAYQNKTLHNTLKDINNTTSLKDSFSNPRASLSKMAAGIVLNNRTNDLSIRRAFPTFKIYFIEDDSTDFDKTDGQTVRAFDDFYSYSSIQEIRIHKSRKIAADIAVIRMTNIGGVLFRRRFGESEISSKENDIEKQGIFADTERENPFERMVLQDGVKVQIRLGYASNPDDLASEFLGQIIEVAPAENGKIVEITCQGYAAELEAVELGPLEDGPVYYSTQQALSQAIIQDSIANFGRQDRFAVFNPAEIRHAWTGGDGVFLGVSPSTLMQQWSEKKMDKLMNKYRFKNFPQDDNIFAPPPHVYTSSWERFFDNACMYRPLKQTAWEIFKEHELRHPGYIASPVPYGHSTRMTMFFGAKGQFYWAAPPSKMEIELARSAEANTIRMGGSSFARANDGTTVMSKIKDLSNSSPTLASAFVQDIISGGKAINVGKELGKIFGRYRPFRNYHYFDSEHHILKNEIRTSVQGTFNEVEVLYFGNENQLSPDDDTHSTTALGRFVTGEKDALYTGEEKLIKNIQSLQRGGEEVLSTKLDQNIPEKDIRSYREDFPSCITEAMAKRYTQGLFARTLRDSYKGELCVIGKEGVKPYDVCYINDRTINMTGPIEVESVTQIFNRDHGFVSIVTPDLCVEVNEMFSATTLDLVAAGYFWIWGVDDSEMGSVASAAAYKTNPVSLLALTAGVKLISWTQDGAPVVITPLSYGGKPFVSVSLGQKHSSLVLQMDGKWDQWWDDLEASWSKFDIAEEAFDTRISIKEKIAGMFAAKKLKPTEQP